MHYKPIALPIDDRPPLLARVRKRRLEITGVRVIGLTLVGCIIEWHAWTLREGQKVLIALPGLADLISQVLWVEKGSIGLRFDQPLPEIAYDHLVRSFRTT